jgi:hypothetical protein
MHFLSRTQIITALGAVALAALVLDLVRRRRLSEEYSLLWLISTTVIAVLGFSTPILSWLTRALGILGESSTVFAAGLAFLTAMLLYVSVRLSRLGFENHALTRELALLRFEIERLRADAGSAGPPPAPGLEGA